MSTDRAPVSVCIVCRNEGDRLDACLASVQWADEIIVMDLESTDDSVAIAERHGARVIRREVVRVVELVRNEVAAAARHDWILALDPDERITPGLAAELTRASQRADIDAVVIPRTNWDFGYPPSNPDERYEQQLRMYRRSRVTWPVIPNLLPQVSEERKYRVPRTDETVMVHDRNRNIPEVLDRIVRVAPLQAQSMIDRGQVFSARAMITALGTRAKRQFIDGRAWRDGVPGLLRAGILVAFHFYIWAAFWQLSGAKRTPADDRFVRRLGLVVDRVYRSYHYATAPIRILRRVGARVGGRRGGA
ncbi:MAG TPA: glycosyltransferase [Gemmatimonadaceae bacterium]|jgi:glycosyltransferase involved in cell wall biosynthesis|nr:glycosyltransferase [Gemmatimonadaceae bacterium]